ncbi:type IV pilus biogenesis protein PilM [Peribacillus glennii]|uniref:Pilus assembly protein PilM n=1 Tax=Peribacillus glennii TaxID=2303991 RepID=A0A372LHW7_9BACI|nr:pilus assembly protein PilM [Peribacillus glennii]RFU65878.1 pilus assembly protein PilM [Peribacillus glennii]
MDLSFLTGKKRIANIVFKDHVIRYTELKQYNPPVIQTCGEYYLPAGIIKDGKIIDFDALQDIVEQCIDEWKISKRQVRFLVPDPCIVIRKIMIPKDVKNDEIEGYLYLELGSTIHLPFEDPVFDTVILGQNQVKRELLLFAAPEEIVSDYSSLLQACRLSPIAADISPLSLYRLYHLSDPSLVNEHVMLVQFDLQAVNASIFVEDKPIFMRHIPIPDGEDQWEKASLRNNNDGYLLYTGDKEQYMQMLGHTYTEIERVLDFYKYSLNQEQESVTKILISGDHPFLDDFILEMKKRFSIPVHSLEKRYIQTIKGEALASSYYLPAGLALKGGK